MVYAQLQVAAIKFPNNPHEVSIVEIGFGKAVVFKLPNHSKRNSSMDGIL